LAVPEEADKDTKANEAKNERKTREYEEEEPEEVLVIRKVSLFLK
jgi:hypothetical protein